MSENQEDLKKKDVVEKSDVIKVEARRVPSSSESATATGSKIDNKNPCNLADCSDDMQGEEENLGEESHSTESVEEDVVAPLPTDSLRGRRKPVEFVVDAHEELDDEDDPFSQRTELAYLVFEK